MLRLPPHLLLAPAFLISIGLNHPLSGAEGPERTSAASQNARPEESAVGAAADSDDSEIGFVRDIRPILSENCFFCHGPDEEQRQAGLRLDTERGTHSVILPGSRESSELMSRLTSDDPSLQMPPPDSNRELTAEQIERIGRWIDAGAPWQKHWSFRPIEPPKVPEIRGTAAAPVRNPIDAFVQQRLQQEGLEPSPEADRRTLIRRLSLDLTGLPPKPAEVEAFVNSGAPDAYGKLVDRLLDSPAYGERMAWEWLDAARYADTNGYQGDRERTMWPWRDWVVDAFNDNMPFDQFTLWQLAGDLLPGATEQQRLATGFSRNHMINGEGGRIAEENRVEYVMDMTETMGTVWLGLTLNCCRCHDHKYDPLTNREYYQLTAFFNQTPVDGAGRNPQTKPNLAVPTMAQQNRLEELNRQLGSLDARIGRRREQLRAEQRRWETEKRSQLQQLRFVLRPAPPHAPHSLHRYRLVRASAAEASGDPAVRALAGALETPPRDRSDEQRKRIAEAHHESDRAMQKLRSQRQSRAAEKAQVQKQVPRVMVMRDMEQRRQSYMLERGLYNKRGEEVQAGVPEVFPGLKQAAASQAGAPPDRLDLARWLVSDRNPLTARVTVNRFWQQIFGTGLVKTAEDFGVQGEIPPQMDLLNWLAAEFRDSGWDVKALMRLIVTSHTYRQSSKISDQSLQQRDPENRLLARGSRYRMPSWMIRDAALAAAGLLSPVRGGPGVNTYQPDGVWAEATFGKKKYQRDRGDALYRRSLYIFWRRIVAPTIFFDNASRQTCTVNDSRTNTPLHALRTLNDVTFVEAARVLAGTVLTADGGDDSERLRRVFERVLARPPQAAEARILLAGLEKTRQRFSDQPAQARELLTVGEMPRRESLDSVEHASWTALCLAVLNLDETLNRE